LGFLLARRIRCSCSLCSSQGTGEAGPRTRPRPRWTGHGGRRSVGGPRASREQLPHNGTVTHAGGSGSRWCRAQPVRFPGGRRPPDRQDGPPCRRAEMGTKDAGSGRRERTD